MTLQKFESKIHIRTFLQAVSLYFDYDEWNRTT